MKMINKIILGTAALLSLWSCGGTQNTVIQDRPTAIYKDIAYLADDLLAGRAIGTPGEQMAAAYIAKRFKAMGILPKGDHGDYLQAFTRKVGDNPHLNMDQQDTKTITGYNVVGYIDHGAETTIIIGAHYDHLAEGSSHSLDDQKIGIHNGADDNASGVAGVLALADRLQIGPKQNNYLLMAFSGEEQGLWGSNFFVKNPTIDLSATNYMINMDMIGRYDANRGLAIHGTGTAAQWKPIINKLRNKYKGLKIKEHESGIGPSDFTSFYLKDIPVLSFFTGQHEDYHKPTDDIDKINFTGIDLVVDLISDIINETDDSKLSFIKTKDKKTEAPNFKVTLGVIPDYLFDGRGMRIDGVRDDRPAFNAGMKKGDIVVKMGSDDVVDMMSYMKSLAKYKKGDQVEVSIERDKKVVVKQVQF